MSNSGKIIYTESEENDLVLSSLQKFINLGRTFFDFDINDKIEFNLLNREASKFYRYSFPENINEYFFRYEEAPVIWLCESPLNRYLKDFYRHNYPVMNGIDQFKSIRDIYNKWLIIKGEEKKYFALSVLKFIDSYNSRSNFFGNILAGVVASYDQTLYNPQKSIELYNKAIEIINKIKLKEKSKEELRYLVNLFIGFSNIIQNENDLAKINFEDAIKLKPAGITAKFHLALVNMKLNESDAAINFLKDVYNFDKERIEFAIENLSFNLFHNFIYNAVTNKFFNYNDFLPLTEQIDEFLSLTKVSGISIIKTLRNKWEVFKITTEESTFSPDIFRNISFLERVMKKYEESKIIHYLNAAEKLQNLFLNTIELIKKEIRDEYYNEIKVSLSGINSEIQIRENEVEDLNRKLENKKGELKKKLNETVKSVEEKITEDISNLENKIKDLPLMPKLNPQNSFKHAMTYNFVLSSMVFIMGGCAGYSNSFVSDVSEIKNLLSVTLLTGIKWGMITFLIGIVVSSLFAGFTLIERSNRRQKLLFNISELKNQKEKIIRKLKKEAEIKEYNLVESYNLGIKNMKNRIKELISEKEARETELKAEADKIIEEKIKPFDYILS